MAQVTLIPTRDTALVGQVPDTTFGTESYTRVGLNAGKLRDALYGYDLTGLPATITTATLKVYRVGTFGTPTGTFNVSRVLRTDWSEAQATWNSYKTGSAWTSAGCQGSGTDYTTTNQVTGISYPGSDGGSVDVDVTNMVNDALAAGSTVSFRLFPISPTEGSEYRLGAREGGTNITSLIIDYVDTSTGGFFYMSQ